jgi:hypothetical protein
MKNSLIAIQCIVLCLACTSTVIAQTPDAELGIWSGSVVIKKSYAALSHTKTSTLMVTGYMGGALGPNTFHGLITNLDSRENAKDSSDQSIYLPVNQLAEGGAAGIRFLVGGRYDGTVVTKTLRFTKKAATNKMVSLSYKIKANEDFVSGADVAVEVSVTLSWKKALPAGL